MKKIVLTGGGTAGHVTPNIALMPELRKRGYDISYIGSYEGMEKGMNQKALDIARNMLADSVDINLIMKYSGLTQEQIEKLK